MQLSTLTKRQRQRRRENQYWDKVLLHTRRQLARIWAQRQLQERVAFDEAIQEHLDIVAATETLRAKKIRGETLRRSRKRSFRRRGFRFD